MDEPHSSSRPRDVRGSSSSGARWLGAAQAAQVVLQWGFQVALARILVPEEFGLLATVLILTNLLALLAELGVGPALVQRPELEPAHILAARRITLVVALLLFAAGSLSAPGFAALFAQPRLVPLVPVLCTMILFTPLVVVPRSLLMREMKFRPIALAETGGILAGGALAVALALAGMGVWSLAIGTVATQGISALLIRRARPWKAPPGTRVSMASMRAVRGFGLMVTATGAVNYAQANVDYLAIARHGTAGGLGLYTLAFNLMSLPHRRFSILLSRIALPAVSAVQEEPERLRRGYFFVTRQVALIAFPAMAGLGIVAPDFIPVVYGENWAGAVLPLQLLCACGWARALGNPSGTFLDGTGRPHVNLALNLLLAVLVAAGAFLAVPHGIEAVAGAVAAANILVFPVVQGTVLRCIGMRAGRYLRALMPGLGGTAAMLAVLVPLRLFVLAGAPAALRLALLVVLGGAVYLGYEFLLHREALLEGVRAVRERRG